MEQSKNTPEKICPRSRGKLTNTRNGESFWAGCRTYGCPVCGPKKIRRLKKAILNWLRPQKHVRIWTFTLTSALFLDKTEHFRILQEGFRRTIKDIRRLKEFTSASKIHYIAIREPHSSGYTHLHVLVTSYVHVLLVQELFDSHIRKLLASRGDLPNKVCNVHMEAVYTHRGIAQYVVKYITKAIHTIEKPYRHNYSKSNFRLFQVKKGRDCWIFEFQDPPLPSETILVISDGSCSTFWEELAAIFSIYGEATCYFPQKEDSS